MRTSFLTFGPGMGLMGVVVLLLSTGAGVTDTPVAATIPGLVVLIAGVASVGTVALVGRRPLDCEHLARSFRTRFFLQIGAAQGSALIAFVMFILTDRELLDGLGFLFAGAGFWILAPTVGRLERLDQQTRLMGCPDSLIAALAD